MVAEKSVMENIGYGQTDERMDRQSKNNIPSSSSKGGVVVKIFDWVVLYITFNIISAILQ